MANGASKSVINLGDQGKSHISAVSEKRSPTPLTTQRRHQQCWAPAMTASSCNERRTRHWAGPFDPSPLPAITLPYVPSYSLRKQPQRGPAVCCVTSHPANSAAGIQTCRSDLGAGARCLCHAVSSHLFLISSPKRHLETGERAASIQVTARWLGLNDYTEGPTLALVSLLPRGWGWGLARAPSFKGTPPCLPGRERTLWLAESGYQC